MDEITKARPYQASEVKKNDAAEGRPKAVDKQKAIDKSARRPGAKRWTLGTGSVRPPSAMR